MSSSSLPSVWLSTQLGNVIPYGKTHKTEPSDISNDCWVLELEDIEKDSSKILKRLDFSQRQSKSTKNIFKKGDVLYGKLRPYLNKIVMAASGGVCTTEIIPLSGGRYIDNKYIFYWLKHPEFQAYVARVGYGVNMPRLGTKDGITAPFVLAPLAEQKQIATKLDELLAQVDTIKTRLDAIPAILKRFRQSVLAAAVSGKLTEEWRVINNLNSITKESSLKELGSIVGGKTPSKSNPKYWKDGIIPWVSPKDMKVDEIVTSKNLITELAMSQGGMKFISNNSVLMVTRSGILAHTFPVAITKTKVTINQDIKAFTANEDKILAKYSLIVLKGLAPKILFECSKTGTTVPSVGTELLINMKFLLPSISEQAEIVSRVEQLFTFADKIEQKVKNAQSRVNNLTQSILAKAFRGELTAEWREQNPDLISGENSAEALLERIKLEREKLKPVKKAKKKKVV